jgi:TPR repeat protein
MAEPILSAVPGRDAPANPPLRQDDAPWRRFRGELEGLIFLAAVAIIGIALAVSVVAASLVLLWHQGAAVRPATPSLVPRASTAAPAPAAAVKRSPSQVAALPAPAPPPAVPRIDLVVPKAATSPPATAPPRGVPAPAQTPKPESAAAKFALAQGDANLSAGEVSVARFYYLQAVDRGDADAAVRMGETFDPAFLTPGRLRRLYADPEAASFWYQRALALGVAEAKQLLATDPAESEATPPARSEAARSERHRHRAAATRRYDRHASAPATGFERLLQRILNPSR